MTSPSPSELAAQLKKLGFRVLPDQLEDFLGRAKKGRWSTRAALAEMARLEEIERSRRSLERRLGNARIGRFKPLVDFDWDWPKKIDRPLIERALTLDFVPEGRNLILLGANGLGKTMITKNIAHAAVLAGHSVLFRTASELLDDLQLDSSLLLRRRLKKYARPALLCIDEVGYLSYDCHAADLLYEVINRRYEHRSVIVTTNRAFKTGTSCFPTPPASSVSSIVSPTTPTSPSLKVKAIAAAKASRRRLSAANKIERLVAAASLRPGCAGRLSEAARHTLSIWAPRPPTGRPVPRPQYPAPNRKRCPSAGIRTSCASFPRRPSPRPGSFSLLLCPPH